MIKKADTPINAKSNDEDIIDRARELYHRDGEIEIDADAEVSPGAISPEGTYVQAWVWVPFDEVEPE